MEIYIGICAVLCIIGILWAIYITREKKVPVTKPNTISELKTLREVKDTGPIKPKPPASRYRYEDNTPAPKPRVTRDIPKTDTRYYPTSTIHSSITHVDHGSSLVDNIATAIIIHEILKDDPKPYTPPPAPQPTYQPEPEREETRRTYYEPPPAPYESPSVSSFTSSSDSYGSSDSGSSSDYGSSSFD